tara:strand:+ start:10378 stop:11289 length:912 start_codon:yes stop_codon:yes gene_type:complete
MVLNNFVEVSMELEKYPQFHKRFMNLRKLWGVTEEFYENELSKTTFVVGSGKSGMKMWFSKTGYFFIKEMTKGDKLSLKKLMNDYIMYMRINKNSLLPKFYGIYKKNNIVYVIQKNLNPYKNGTWVFDLKGSHRRRTVLNYTIKKIGKDNNFGDSKIFINNAKKIKKQMKKDTTFLKKHNLMDYSLLLCMRTKPVKEKDWKIWGKGNFCCDMKGPGPSKKTPININMGIIDILQKYNIKKKMESVFKSKRHFIRTKRSSSEVSAIDSESYKERFDDFMDGIIQLKNNTTRKKKRTRKKRTRKK